MAYRFDNVVVDPFNHEVRVDGASQPIEPQVMAVLEYLIEQRHRVVPKDELLDEVWGSRFVSAAAVTSRIKSARQAIGDSGKAQSMIRTVHGRGYRFVAELTGTPSDASSATDTEPRDTVSSPPATTAPDDSFARAAHPVDDGWPLIGRDRELATLLEAAQRADTGGLLLTGPAGLGKTRLARALIETSAAAGHPVARVNGQLGTSNVPLAAIAHLLPDDVSEDGLVGEMARSRLLQRARHAFVQLGGDRRLVLMVDDVDRVDSLSLALLGSLIADGTIFSVMTQRVEGDEAMTLGHLVRSGRIDHVGVEPIPDDQMIALLGRALDGPVRPDTNAAFVSAAAGIPGIMRQLVESSLASGALTQREGVWRITGRLTASRDMAAAVSGRLETLTDDQRDALELLAIAGDVDLDVAFELIDDAVLDQLELEGLISVRAVGRAMRIRVAHPLFGEILTDALSPLRERRHRAALADALAASPLHSRADRLVLVRLQLENDTVIAPDHLIESARLAFIESDTELALRLLRRVTEDERTPEHQRLLGEVLYFRGRFDDAAEVWQSLDLDAIEPETAAGVVRRLSTWMFYGKWRFDEAIDYLGERLESFEGEHRRELEAYWTMIAAVDARRADEAIERAHRLVPVATGIALVDAASGLAMAYFARGKHDLAVEWAEESIKAATGLEQTIYWSGPDYTEFVEILAHLERGDIAGGWATFERVTEPGSPPSFGFASVAAGRLALYAGNYRQVLDWLDPHIQIAEALGITTNGRPLQAPAGVAALMLGQHDRAKADAAALRSDLPDVANLTCLDITWAILRIEGALGDPGTAVEELLRAATAAADARIFYIESLLLSAAIPLGAAERVVDRLGELTTMIDGELIGLRHRSALASIGRVDADDVLAELERRGLEFEAAALRTSLDP